MKKNTFLILHTAFIIAAFAIIVYLYPVSHQLGGMYLPVPKDEIETNAAAILERLQTDSADRLLSSQIRLHQGLYTHILRQHGIKEGNRLLRDSIPAFYWEIRHSQAQSISEMQTRDGDIVITAGDLRRTTMSLRYDGHGNLIRFETNISDTVYLTGTDADSARYIAEKFLIDFTSYDPERLVFISHREQVLDRRTDHTFRWESTQESDPLPYSIEVRVAGSLISHYRMDYDIPARGSFSAQETINVLSSSVPYVIVGIMMLIIGIKRIRSHEIGFKNGLIIGIIAGVSVGVTLYIQLIDNFQWEFLIAIILGPIMIGAFVAFVIIVSEAVGRNTWKEKFIPFDLISNGHFLHSAPGTSYIRGTTYGLAVFAAYLTVLYIVDAIHPLWYSFVQSNPLENYSPPFPAIKMTLNEIWMELTVFSMMLFFVVTYLRQRISNIPWLIITAAVIFGITQWNHTFPLLSGIIISIIYALFLVWIIYRFDVVTGYLTVLTFSLAGTATSMLMSGNDYFLSEGIIIASVFGILITGGIVSQYTRDRVTDYDDIAPVFQKYISERERLQRELEIAHDVQMSFLPKEKPVIPKLDAAGKCIPANEVGGDYYDFIRINDHLFGVVIGDVSGKGTKASFYMTLTKGILRSTARNETNPARVLTDVNRTFYEIAERGSFISMVYGIFDLKTNCLTVARAGHNPVILWKSASANGELISPKGIALGLDSGELFSNAIRQITVQYEPGDVFIFYTDGFSEASNRNNEEFGDERLLQTAQKYNALPAEEMLNNIITETYTFTGRTPQRDDMTMVVVKVMKE